MGNIGEYTILYCLAHIKKLSIITNDCVVAKLVNASLSVVMLEFLMREQFAPTTAIKLVCASHRSNSPGHIYSTSRSSLGVYMISIAEDHAVLCVSNMFAL